MEKIFSEFIMELLSSLGVPIHTVALPCDDWTWLDMGLRRTIFGSVDHDKINQRLAKHEKKVVYHFTDPFQCSYTTICLPEHDGQLILGPFLFEHIAGRRFDELAQSLKLPEASRNYLYSYYQSIRFLPDQAMYENLFILISDHVFGRGQYKIIYEDSFFLDEAVQLYNNHFRILNQPFVGIQHIESQYSLENMIVTAVIGGNEHQATEHISKLAALATVRPLINELRDCKNLCIAVNTLLRKAAEQSGVHPIHIDSYSNHKIQLIEQLTSAEQCRGFCRKLAQGYCRLVQKYSLKAYSPPIRKAITYINTDLTTDLSLKSLATQININASYLSGLFKKETGVPLTEYVNRCRIGHAQLLLLTTDLPIKAIAAQCGIPDMQYFSRIFKRITGVTPKVYQETTTFETRREFGKAPINVLSKIDT